MKTTETTGTIQLARRRRAPVVPALFALGVALVSIGAGIASQGIASRAPTTPANVTAAAPAAGHKDWRFVLGSPVTMVLGHRPGLSPADAVRTHAFGWEGTTIREAGRDSVFVRVLRRDPAVTPLDLVRMEARGS